MKRVRMGEALYGACVDTPSGMSRWSGSDCEIVCGPAIVTTEFGKPSRIANCLLPDGGRGEAEISPDHIIGQHAGGENAIWKRRLGPDAWIFGFVEIGSDDATFSDLPEMKRRDKTDAIGLEADLMGDSPVLAAIADKAFATRLYAAITNITWTRNGEAWDCSWRYAAGLIADLRGRNEGYLDFYGSAAEGVIANDVRFHLTRLGWTPQQDEESDR